MALKYLNPQDELINSLEGIYLVDAGAGTGKTYSIVRRYGKIIENGAKPEDILLVTFTKKAAQQMSDEVIKKLSTEETISKLLEAPILTFHSFCIRVLKKGGSDSPSYLDLNEFLGKNFTILEEFVIENEIFRKFYLNFIKVNRHKYTQLIYSLEGMHESVLRLIKKLCSRGLFPSTKGWKEDDAQRLRGRYEDYSEYFDRMNEKVIGKRDPEIQNKLYKKFSIRTNDKLYLDFNKEEVFDGKFKINANAKGKSFKDELQDEHINFIGEVYIAYIEYLLKRNLMNYEFVTMFAYLTLYNNAPLRKSIQFDYVMVDEFQDTDEIQFKLILMLCKGIKDRGNLCVVGDWKQGIYSFRNASIKNITEFQRSIKAYKKELNRGEVRVNYNTDEFKKIIFNINYRSSDSILKFSRNTLFVKGSNDEEMDIETIEKNFKEPLIPFWDLEELTEINFYKTENRISEYELILKKISELVNEKNKYKIRVFNKETHTFEERPVRYSDICILSRTKKFSLELKREGLLAGIPINYGGGLELFASEPGVLTLAWLRLIINEKDIKGWLPVLDKEGYSYPEIRHFMDNYIKKYGKLNKLFPDFPVELYNFLNHIRSFKNNILFAVEAVLKRYNFQNETGNKVINVIQGWMKSDLISLNVLIELINSSSNTEFEIELGSSSDAVLTQTIHVSKGLEYPVVILANMNDKTFPIVNANSESMFYEEVSGIRTKNFYASNERFYYKFHNWRTDLVGSVIRSADYDEERRLLYVAVTRAKQYLFLTSSKPSQFFTELSKQTNKEIISGYDYNITETKISKKDTIKKIEMDFKVKQSRKFISPHGLMDEVKLKFDKRANSEDELATKSVEDRVNFGLQIHNAAHKIANGLDVETSSEEIKRMKKFINALKADELKSETDFLFPKDDKIIRGTIDLIAFYDDRIVVIDYKTDTNKNYLEKYKIQIEVYKDVVKSIYKDRKVTGKIYFLSLDEVVEIS